MRVLQIMEATLGGTRRYLEDVALAAERIGYDNGLAYSLVRADAAFLTLLDRLQSAGWKTYEIDMRRSVGFHDARSVAAVRHVYRDFKPDLVHAQSSKAGAVARLAALSMRDRPALVYSPGSIAVALSPMYEIAERCLAPMLDGMVAVGPSERRQLEDLRLVRPDKLHVVVPTIAEAHFLPRDRAAARAELGFDRSPIVAAVGRLTAQKDPLAFVAFLRELRARVADVRAIWVGDGELRGAFEAALADAGLADAVTISGWVTDVRPYFAAADLFVSTSTYESFGYVTAEALASGRPVVASAITGTIDIVTSDIEHQLYPPGDIRTAAERAAVFLRDAAFAETVARRGRAGVLESFSAERTQRQLAAAYDAAIARRVRTRLPKIAQAADRAV